jgi:hypothetical protein
MKIRTGFVSNSSSSSFVVLFPKEPKSAADVRDMLFTNGESVYLNPYFYGGNDTLSWPVSQVAETVWNDICDQKKNDFERAKMMLTYGIIEDNNSPNYKDYDYIDIEKSDKYHSDRTRYAQKKLKEFFNLRKLKLMKINDDVIPGDSMYCFEYSDNDGTYFSALEHGNLFDNLKHIRISNH